MNFESAFNGFGSIHDLPQMAETARILIVFLITTIIHEVTGHEDFFSQRECSLSPKDSPF